MYPLSTNPGAENLALAPVRGARKRLTTQPKSRAVPRRGSNSPKDASKVETTVGGDFPLDSVKKPKFDGRKEARRLIAGSSVLQSIPMDHFIDSAEILLEQDLDDTPSAIIGRGAQAIVFRAEVSGSRVAVKVSREKSILAEYAIAVACNHKRTFCSFRFLFHCTATHFNSTAVLHLRPPVQPLTAL